MKTATLTSSSDIFLEVIDDLSTNSLLFDKFIANFFPFDFIQFIDGRADGLELTRLHTTDREHAVQQQSVVQLKTFRLIKDILKNSQSISTFLVVSRKEWKRGSINLYYIFQ